MSSCIRGMTTRGIGDETKDIAYVTSDEVVVRAAFPYPRAIFDRPVAAFFQRESPRDNPVITPTEAADAR